MGEGGGEGRTSDGREQGRKKEISREEEGGRDGRGIDKHHRSKVSHVIWALLVSAFPILMSGVFASKFHVLIQFADCLLQSFRRVLSKR